MGSEAIRAADEAPATRSRGRPRLTPEELQARVDQYCRRFGVKPGDDGLPPFPSGRRETAQHREWMALYKAHRRIAERSGAPSPAEAARIQEALTAQRARCTVCHEPLELRDARLDRPRPDNPPLVLHARCLELVELARALGPDALERARRHL